MQYPIKSVFLFLLLITNNSHAQFSDNTEILHSSSGGGFYGWAVSALKDINNDLVMDYIVSSTGTSTVKVFSGATGDELHSFQLVGSRLGQSVADAGDVDGDGVNDIIAGGINFNGITGIAVVYSGANGNEIWRFEGEATGDRFGSSVSSAGDVDGDGKSDLLIGADSNSISGSSSGRVYVYSGATGQLIRNLEAESAQDRFGGGVALLGDLNGDGIDEHIVGAFGAGSNNGGKAYVYSGSNGNLLFSLSPDTGANVFGQFFVADAGDVDNDGITDIYVGDYNHNNGAGKVYVFSGHTQQVLQRIEGGTGEGAGPGRHAGDVNNDGFADVIVGFYTAGGNQTGRVEVISGADGSILQSMTHSIANGQLGFDAVGIGDVNGDNKDDYLITAANGNVVYVVAGRVEKEVNVNINSGMNGAWFNPETSGQGVFVSVFPDQGNVFIGFFTFDRIPNSNSTADLGYSNHRWFTAFGAINGDHANLQMYLTTGGIFNDPEPVVANEYGLMKIKFIDCLHAEMELAIPILNLSVSIPLSRPTAENQALCESLSAAVR